VLFLDDSPANVKAGNNAGFSAVRAAGVDQARSALVDALVIDA
jgi:hypothetical protein